MEQNDPKYPSPLTCVGFKKVNLYAMDRYTYNELRGWSIPEGEKNDEGYLVEYLDGGESNHKDFEGYISWTPKEVADKAYRPISKSAEFNLSINSNTLNYNEAERIKWAYAWLWSTVEEMDRKNHDYRSIRTCYDKLVDMKMAHIDLFFKNHEAVSKVPS